MGWKVICTAIHGKNGDADFNLFFAGEDVVTLKQAGKIKHLVRLSVLPVEVIAEVKKAPKLPELQRNDIDR